MIQFIPMLNKNSIHYHKIYLYILVQKKGTNELFYINILIPKGIY